MKLLHLPGPLALCLALSACGSDAAPAAASQTVPVVAAENFYGDLVSQVGGSRVSVASILSDPSVDPHTYESNVDNAKAIAKARLVVENGAGYDSFMDKLMSASSHSDRLTIAVAQLVGAKDGDNPHLWYRPDVMPALAKAVADHLTQADPAGQAEYASRLQQFDTSLQPLRQRIDGFKAKYSGTKVLPTEPVFDYMAIALSLDVVDKEGAFQRAVEEGNDPPAEAVARFRQQLASHTIKALIYNSQTVTPITTDMQSVAKQNGVPVVGISETEPPGKTYQQWMLDQLTQLEQALG